MKKICVFLVIFCQIFLASTTWGKANTRFDVDLKRLALLKMGATMSESGANYDRAYLWTKAAHWLAVAQDEARNANQGRFSKIAHATATDLLDILEREPGNVKGENFKQAWQIKSIAGVPQLREDLWAPLNLWRTLSIEGAPLAQAGARCALPEGANTEVQLQWAGWVYSEYGWRSALPYLRGAEKSFSRAQIAFVHCRNAAAIAADKD